MYWLNCLSLGSKHSKMAVSCFRMMSQMKKLSVPLVLVLSVLELPDGELGKDTEDSLVVVSDTGCELAGWESLDDGCGSLRSECLVVTPVCLIGMSRSGSVHVQFEFPPVSSRGVSSGLPSRWNRHSAGDRVVPEPCHLGSSARLDPSCLALSLKTKTWDVLVCLILPLWFPERTVFWPLASCWHPEMTKFCLSDSAFPSLVCWRDRVML